MSKLRKVQFFRNSSLTAYANHDAAVTAAKAAWVAQNFANMEDGELLLYRYTITGETGAPAHTIVGVVRNNNGTKDFEVLANYDMFSGSISSLNVADYAQANIDTETSPTETTITIKGIQENGGIISAADDTSVDTNIKVDGVYDDTNNKIATQSTVTNAIAALDSIADADTASGTGYATITTTTPTADFKVLNSVTEVDGVLTAGEAYQLKKVAATGAAADVSIADSGNLFTATDVEAALAEVQGNVNTVAASIKDGKIQWNNGTNDVDVFSANTSTNLTLRPNDFVVDESGKLGVNVQTLTSATNKIATMLDIASLSGAMHYKGGVTAYPTPTAATKAGDTYVVTSTFTESGVTYEVGDMLVANADGASATYTVVQSNMTIGTGAGQVAANQTALTANEIVVAGSTGVQTTGYTIGGEVGAQSTTALPTAKQVYDAIDSLAVNSVSETVVVTNGSDSATVTDTLTVDGTAAAGQAFTIAGGEGVNVTAASSTITVAADVAQYAHEGDTTTVSTASASNLLKIDASGELSVSDTWDCGVYS